MKYMIMMFGDQATMVQEKSRDWIAGMIEFMNEFGGRLHKSGELLGGEGLADPTEAKRVSISDGVPVVTDGPYAEAKESLAGYWLIEVADEARALELAAEIVAFTGEPLEVRAVADAPPEF